MERKRRRLWRMPFHHLTLIGQIPFPFAPSEAGVNGKEMNRIIFCPFCANKLIMKAGHLFCEVGGCGFSEKIQNQLEEEICKVGAQEISNPRISQNKYYCPNCRTELIWSESIKRNLCENCGLSLSGGFTHSLREYHNHK